MPGADYRRTGQPVRRTDRRAVLILPFINKPSLCREPHMRHLFLTLLGASFITMSTPATSDTGSTLLLETTKGQVEIKLLPDLAPNHVARITELANDGFYDGIIFHRVIPGFMAQTGDPTGTGMGGSGQNLKAEFSDYQYQYGTVGMARAMSPD
ncbi:MAG: peptidylprolyl isomerase, partial [Rhodobiaceae bacterium]